MARKPIDVEALTHDRARRKNIPTAEFESVMRAEEKEALRVAYERRNRDLDPQLVWRGKDVEDASDLVASAPPLYIQEKVHPKVIIDDLMRQSSFRAKRSNPETPDLFDDFNGLDLEAKTEFYRYDQHWSNRMIVGDSLAVMASLAEREGLRGQVQCIYIDPPYGIRFNSNFQWSTTSRDVKDGAKDQITREPEQVRAFRDTWRDGVHSYLTYLRDRLTVARDLLSESGSIFVQIGDENVHRVRALMDEVFGEKNFLCSILIQKTGTVTGEFIQSNTDNVLWYVRDIAPAKFRSLFVEREGEPSAEVRAKTTLERDDFGAYSLTSDGFRETTTVAFFFEGQTFHPGQNRHWGVKIEELARAGRAGRITRQDKQVRMRYFWDDYPVRGLGSIWTDVGGATGKVYVVQTAPKVLNRLFLMSTDPGDLVLDPTCGSGTTAYVAEQWGRRWITIDTSRVAIALARSRLMGARYPYYLLADSAEGQRKEWEVSGKPLRVLRADLRDLGVENSNTKDTKESTKDTKTHNDIRLGFVYERVPHITLKSIANNAEIDVIWEKWEPPLRALREKLGVLCVEDSNTKDTKESTKNTKALEEWEVPREFPKDWPAAAKPLHEKFWEARIARQKEIDASIAAKAEFETLYDKPYVDNSRIRVAGPFTVESLSPHRTLAVDWDDELIDTLEASEGKRKADGVGRDEAIEDFAQMILENLKVAGVQQAHKEDRIAFTSLSGWPGHYICGEGIFVGDLRENLRDLRVEKSKHEGHEGGTKSTKEVRAGIFIGPEFGTVSRPDLVAAAREAGDAGFDVLIACAFNYDAHSAEFDKLGRVPILKARMNPDLHMGGDLKATGAGNLFVIFGEPDIRIDKLTDGRLQVKVFGVDVFKPQTGEVVSEGIDGIALWMLDDDYNEESFFVRHAYFLGANDPYKALKTTLKAEIDEEAWSSLYSDTSRPFAKPKSGRIAVKVINHLGDEVMKVFAVS